MEGKKTKYSLMSNAELNIRKRALEDEYDAKKSEVINIISRLEELDKEYIELKEELDKRGGVGYVKAQ